MAELLKSEKNIKTYTKINKKHKISSDNYENHIKIIKFYEIITKINKNLECHAKKTKNMKIIKFTFRIMKIMKILELHART